jgi:hypothetical protein
MTALPLFSLFAFIVMLVLLPILFLEKLHLSPETALLLMVAIIIGGFVNIPVKRIVHERVVDASARRLRPRWALAGDRPRAPRDNYCRQFRRLCRPDRAWSLSTASPFSRGRRDLLALIVTAGVNVAVCHFSARPRRRNLAARIGACGGGGTAGAFVCSKRCGAHRLYRWGYRAAHRR